jgi:hypothetical protein
MLPNGREEFHQEHRVLYKSPPEHHAYQYKGCDGRIVVTGQSSFVGHAIAGKQRLAEAGRWAARERVPAIKVPCVRKIQSTPWDPGKSLHIFALCQRAIVLFIYFQRCKSKQNRDIKED